MRFFQVLLVAVVSVASLTAQTSCGWQAMGTSGTPHGQLFGSPGQMLSFDGAAFTADWNGVYRFDAAGTATRLGLAPGCGLAVFDVGTGGGPALWSLWQGLVRWDGSTWVTVGPLPLLPVSGTPLSGTAKLFALSDSTGPGLYYLVGPFGMWPPTSSLEKWDPVTGTWSWLPLPVGAHVVDLIEFDDGTGPAVYRADSGLLNSTASGPFVHRWDPGTQSWTPLPWGISGFPDRLVVFDDGSGPALFAVGREHWSVGGYLQIAKWTPGATSWTVVYSDPGAALDINATVVFDDGSGPALVVGCSLPLPGGNATWVAKWTGSSLAPLATGMNPHCYPGFHSPMLAVVNDGTTASLWAAGDYFGVGVYGPTSTGIARLDCGSSITISYTQPGGPGAPVYVSNANLTPGREYHNLISIEPCPGGPMSFPGPYGSCLSNSAIQFLLTQLQWPVGYEPFHFIAPSSYVVWPPLTGLPPITVDALCIEMNNGVPAGTVSPVVQITVQ